MGWKAINADSGGGKANWTTSGSVRMKLRVHDGLCRIEGTSGRGGMEGGRMKEIRKKIGQCPGYKGGLRAEGLGDSWFGMS
jgi:hypothetical protein